MRRITTKFDEARIFTSHREADEAGEAYVKRLTWRKRCYTYVHVVWSTPLDGMVVLIVDSRHLKPKWLIRSSNP